jgi:hypothetical protein
LIAPRTFKFSYISVPISTRRFVFPIHSFAPKDVTMKKLSYPGFELRSPA